MEAPSGKNEKYIQQVTETEYEGQEEMKWHLEIYGIRNDDDENPYEFIWDSEEMS